MPLVSDTPIIPHFGEMSIAKSLFFRHILRYKQMAHCGGSRYPELYKLCRLPIFTQLSILFFLCILPILLILPWLCIWPYLCILSILSCPRNRHILCICPNFAIFCTRCILPILLILLILIPLVRDVSTPHRSGLV